MIVPEILLNIVSTGFSGRFFMIESGYTSPKLDMSIEGMRSQQFSVAVFFFMLLGILVFSSIVYVVIFSKASPKKMRVGERIMFGAIILGIIFAIIFGALQMLSGYLF